MHSVPTAALLGQPGGLEEFLARPGSIGTIHETPQSSAPGARGVEVAQGCSVLELPQSPQCSLQPGSLGLAGRAGWCGPWNRLERLPEYSWSGMVWLGRQLKAHPVQLSATFH